MRRLLGAPGHTWRQLMSATGPRETALASRLRTEMRRTAIVAASNVLVHHAVDSGFEAHYRQVKSILTSAYHEGMPVFGKMILSAFGKSRPKPYEPLVRNWIENTSAKKVAQITSTSRDQLRSILARGQKEGLGTVAIAKMIRDDFGETIGRARSETIARTEMHSAANAAQYMAADSLGIPNMQREWIAADDERTRDDHAAASGQVVGMDEPFDVGGESLMNPGDPGGSPEQVINCRCVTGFIVPD